MGKNLDRVIEIAAEQHGLVTSVDARVHGIDPSALRQLAARGRLESLSRGVYRVPFIPVTSRAEFAAAVAWSGGRGVISHSSALELLELCDVNPRRTHLTIPKTYHPTGQGIERYHLHHATPTPDVVTSVDGIPVTSAERSILDARHAGEDPAQLRRAITTGRRMRMFNESTQRRLTRLLDRRIENGT